MQPGRSDSASPSSGASPSDDAILAMLVAPPRPYRTTAAYRASLLVVACAMVVLPLAYLGLIAAVGWGMWLHVTTALAVNRGGPAKANMIAFVAPLAAGAVAILFMIKPLFAPRRAHATGVALDPVREPLLFRFVERLCEIVHAPMPVRIDVDTEVNASAGFRRGLASFLGTDLVLTIGMPLIQRLSLRELAGVLAHEFGHFTQGGGMRLTYLIQAVNAWFARVVDERDAWDERLIAWTHAGGWVSIVVLGCRGFVWLTRRVLQGLMITGHAISCLALRQMEYDADRQQTRVAGSAAFETTLDGLVELSLAREVALTDLRRTWTTGRLPDELPAFVLATAAALRNATPTARDDDGADDVLGRILAASRESRTGLFDTHPAHRDRIAAALARAEPGLIGVDAPAARLFADPGGLSRSATLAYYRDEIGIDVSTVTLVPTATLAGEYTARTAALEAAHRYFQGPLPAAAGFRLFVRDEPLPVLPEVDIGVATRRVAGSRDAMLAALPAIRAALATYLEEDAACDAAWATSILLDAGVTPSDDTLTRDAARRRAEAASLRRTAALERLDNACDPIRSRLDAALRLRRRPEAAAVVSADEIDRRLRTLAALRDAWGWFPELVDRTLNVMFVLRALSDRETPTQALVTAFHDRLAGLREMIVGVRAALEGEPFPYEHAATNMSIGVHLVPELPAEDDHGGIIATAQAAMERENEMFLRLTAELVEQAEAIENSLGLPPPPTPAAVQPEAPG